MREIKFRAWIKPDEDGNEGLMIHQGDKADFTMISNGNGFAIVFDLEDYEDYIDKEAYEIMQYTGLKDANGKEIYEGDIVRILYTDWPSKSSEDPRILEQYKNDLSHIGEVVCHSLGELELDFGRGYGSLNEGKHGQKEVIGNIYENPELLE